MPTVSIIVPVYNAEKYLGWCVNSILAQTFRDLEVILVNDGSRDGSLEICRNYEKLDSRVRVIDIPNGGVSNARNTGLAAATGEFVQFVDSDDVVKPGITAALLHAIQLYKADLAICGFSIVEMQGDKAINRIDLSTECMGAECVLEKEQFLQQLPYLFWESSVMEGPYNRIFRREILLKKGLRFLSDMKYGEDCMFNIAYYGQCRRVVLLSQCYYYYMWQEGQSLSRRYLPDLFANQRRQLEALESLVKSNGAETKKGRFFFANYAASQVVKCLRMLLNPACPLCEDEKKLAVWEIMQHPHVSGWFAQAEYIQSEYRALSIYFENRDVGGLLKKLQEIEGGAAVLPSVPAGGRAGRLNRLLCKCCHGLRRLFKRGKIHHLAEITELNLRTVGMKTTFQRMGRKLKRKLLRR